MLRKIDRLLIRVPNVASAVRYYRDVLGLAIARAEGRVASLRLADDDAELVLHADDDLPGEAIYFLVDDVRAMYRDRVRLRLTFSGPPVAVARGYRAQAKDPYGTVLLLLDRAAEGKAGRATPAATTPSPAVAIEDAKAPGALFAGVEHKAKPKRDALCRLYEAGGRTADDLPYTAHFEKLFADYTARYTDGEPRPTRTEVWRHLLNLRKAGKLPKLGDARSNPPAIDPAAEARLRDLLGPDIGKRDRLPYTDRFDRLVEAFNKAQPRSLTPHQVWRVVARLAK